LFWVKGKKYVCKGMSSYGKCIEYMDLKKKKCFGTKKIEKYFNQGSFVWAI
jgi:hypothetical protein